MEGANERGFPYETKKTATFIMISGKAGVYSYATWPGGGPGALGQYIRSLSSSTGVTVKTTPGYSISNQGGC
jgi:hypothetical protein